MDPLSVLAIVAAVVQFVDIGGKILVKGWERYHSLTNAWEPDENDRLSKSDKERKMAEIRAAKMEETKKEGIEACRVEMELCLLFETTSSLLHCTTPAQSHLLQLFAECKGMTSDVRQIRDEIKQHSKDKHDELEGRARGGHGKTETKGRANKYKEAPHHSSGHFFQKSWKRKNTESDDTIDSTVNVTAETGKRLEALRVRMQLMRRNIIDSVVLCIWDDSKRTKQWELHFNKKLDAIVGLLERAHMSGNGPPGVRLQFDEPPITVEALQDPKHGVAIETVPKAETPTAELNETLLPLIRAGQSISLVKLGDDIISSLNSEFGPTHQVRTELVQLLWEKDWTLDTSMANVSADKTAAGINATVVAKSIAIDVRFDTIQLREDIIAENFATTYSWIFQSEPMKHDNMPMWNSFPNWLRTNHSNVYWITGKPGSGKSTMMKFVLQHDDSLRTYLSQWLEPLHLLLLKYYAWRPGHSLQKSIEGLKRAVVSQALELYPMLTPMVAPRRWALFQVLRSHSAFPVWEQWEIEESFEALLSECGKTIKLVLFIDGLDEFQMPPREVVELVQSITASCPNGLKLCVASRPWTEFEDEFNEGPMLQMHVATRNDMATFITGSFEGNKGFIEQRKLYPEAAAQLLTDLVQKANGVFLWVSVVVHHLLDLLKEGQSIHQSQETLKDLPTDLSSLYDAIWASIRPDNLRDASFMMQVLNAAEGPLPWFTMWLIEESRHGSFSVANLSKTNDWKRFAWMSLKRKLAARTRGILEITSGSEGVVDFIHRTAWDWARQPDIWGDICLSYKDSLNPCLALLEAETLLLSERGGIAQDRHIDMWRVVTKALWYASQVSDNPKNTDALVRGLDSFNSTLSQRQELIPGTWTGIAGTNAPKSHWSAGQATGASQRGLHNTFLGLAAQFSILPYIKAKALGNRSVLGQKFSKNSLGLLENSIFGYAYYNSPAVSQDGFRPEIPTARRLDTVRFLIDQGVYQSMVHAKEGVRSLKDEMSKQQGSDSGYYSEVKQYLEKGSFKRTLKSTLLYGFMPGIQALQKGG